MVAPVVLSVAASLKTTAEAAAVPPTYFPSEISLDSYIRLWDYQAGLPHYVANSLGTALLTIALALGADDPGGLRARPPADPGQGDLLRLPAAWP